MKTGKSSRLPRVALVAAVAQVACVPEREETPYQIVNPRVLAVRGIPAEANPGEEVHYEVLVASPDGPSQLDLELAYCLKARRAEERGGVSESCLQGSGLLAVGTPATIPANACALFGPNTPPAEEGEPANRPSDTDASGGYQIPVQVSSVGKVLDPVFGFHRLHCDLAGATRQLFEEYQERYTNNRHPQFASLGWVDDTSGRLQAFSELRVSPGQSVQLQARARADSFEPFVLYSAEDAAILDRKEVLKMNWYVSQGTLRLASETVAQDSVMNANWRAPDQEGVVWGWGILTDSRGGQVWQTFRISVEGR